MPQGLLPPGRVRAPRLDVGQRSGLVMPSRSTVQIAAIAGVAILMGVSFVRAPYLQDQPLLHAPTVVALACLATLAIRGRISTGAVLSILGFLVIHIVGARWVYSNVPYDDWSGAVFGWSVSERLGVTRNHFDRVAHFGYGVLATAPQLEILRRRWRITGIAALAFSFALVMGAGAVYEVCEWIVAIVAAPDWAERYNGQQGDPWDAQKDMALAGLGSLAASALVLASRIRPGRRDSAG